jgi:hypothetical protein
MKTGVIITLLLIFSCFCKKNDTCQTAVNRVRILNINDITPENQKPVHLASDDVLTGLKESVKKAGFELDEKTDENSGKAGSDEYRLSLDILYHAIKDNVPAPSEISGTAFCGILIKLQRSGKRDIPEIHESKLKKEKFFKSTNQDEKIKIFMNLIQETMDAVMRDLFSQAKVRNSENDEIIQMLGSADENLRIHAIEAAGERRIAAAADKLRSLLKSDNTSVLIKVIGSLGQLDDYSSIPDLARFVNSSDDMVVHSSLYAIGDIGGEKAIQYLKLIRESDPRPAVRDEAGDILEKMGR